MIQSDYNLEEAIESFRQPLFDSPPPVFDTPPNTASDKWFLFLFILIHDRKRLAFGILEPGKSGCYYAAYARRLKELESDKLLKNIRLKKLQEEKGNLILRTKSLRKEKRMQRRKTKR